MAKKKISAEVTNVCNVYIHALFTNVIITVTNERGDTLTWCSSGVILNRLSKATVVVNTKKKKKASHTTNAKKKITLYVAQMVAEECAKNAYSLGVRNVNIIIKGVGPSREYVIRTLADNNLKILSITDRTSLPHGGCRPRKARRN